MPRKAQSHRPSKLASKYSDALLNTARELLAEVLTKHKRIENFSVEVPLRELGTRMLTFNAHCLENKGEPLVLLAMGDATQSASRFVGKSVKNS